MKEREETILLRKLLEEEEAIPAPAILSLGDSCYEFRIPIGEKFARIIIENNDYFDLMEEE